MSATKILLFLGSGKGLGEATARKFLNAGYKVATASRSTPAVADDNLNRVHYTVDFKDPSSVEKVFDKVQEKWGAPPSVVVYNAYSHIVETDGPLNSSVSPAAFTDALNVNVTSAFVAASVGKARNPNFVFLYTGNALNQGPLPTFVFLGIGKSGSAHMIQGIVDFEKKSGGGARYYYVDQRDADGGPLYNGVLPEPHAEYFLKLAEQAEQSEPLVVFRSVA